MSGRRHSLGPRVLLLVCTTGALCVSNLASAATITLGQSPASSVQIQALNISGQTVYEIQLGGGSNQPPSNTFVTGAASTTIGSTTYNGFYRLSTTPSLQLRMVNTVVGVANGADDEYDFLTGRDTLKLEFAQTTTFASPWLVADIINVYATQDVPPNGNQHPPIYLFGNMGAPSGGSLASSFAGGGSQIRINIGGNQRLLDLTPPNSYSGLRIEDGIIEDAVPVPAAVWLLASALGFLGWVRRKATA